MAAEPETATEDEKQEEEIDIDLNDPNVDAAATKIQAGFRGHKARKEIKEQKVELYVFDQLFSGEIKSVYAPDNFLGKGNFFWNFLLSCSSLVF